jgi:hypothetical protein
MNCTCPQLLHYLDISASFALLINMNALGNNHIHHTAKEKIHLNESTKTLQSDTIDYTIQQMQTAAL